jgi:hypothetical protein
MNLDNSPINQSFTEPLQENKITQKEHPFKKKKRDSFQLAHNRNTIIIAPKAVGIKDNEALGESAVKRQQKRAVKHNSLHEENKENKIIYGKEIGSNDFDIKASQNDPIMKHGESRLQMSKKGAKSEHKRVPISMGSSPYNSRLVV